MAQRKKSFIKIYIEDRILDKKEVHLLVDINSYNLALLQDIVDTDLKHIAQKLEAKIIRRGNIVFSSFSSTEEACRTQHSKVTSAYIQIRDVVFKF